METLLCSTHSTNLNGLWLLLLIVSFGAAWTIVTWPMRNR